MLRKEHVHMNWNRREWIRSTGLCLASTIGQPRMSFGLEAMETKTSQPTVQPEIFSARAFGAHGDGVTRDTAALQAAVDAAQESGGGTVHLTAGKYLSGTLHLRSHVSLWMDGGAVLLMSPDDADFASIAVPPSVSEMRQSNEKSRALLLGNGIKQAAVYGEGEIEGNRSRRGGPKPIFLQDCEDISIRGITLRNAPDYNLSLFRCSRVYIGGVTILNGYADGIDLDCCRYVRVSDCFVESVDDAICLKASSPAGPQAKTEHIAVSNCTLRTASIALKCGTESCGDFSAITFSNCTLEGGMGLRHGNPGIALYTVDGGNLEDITISNIVMRGVATPFALLLGDRDAWGLRRGPGKFAGVRISGVIASDARFPSVIAGLPGAPIRDIQIDGVTIRMSQAPGREEASVRAGSSAAVPEKSAHYPEPTMFGPLLAFGLYLRHLAQSQIRDLRITADDSIKGDAIAADDLDELILELVAGSGSRSVWLNNLRNSYVKAVVLVPSAGAICRFSGPHSAQISCMVSGFVRLDTQILLDSDLPPETVHRL
jgi:hypothetical protein